MPETIWQDERVCLTKHRCPDCGRWWACEVNYSDTICPVCASRRIKAAIERAGAAERSMRAVRGALTKARARR